MTELDRQGRDALHYAANRNDVEVVRQRLQAGVDVNLPERRNKLTPLHFAINGGAVDTAKMLLAAGADVHQRDSSSATPLLLAVEHWRHSPDGAMIKLLLEHGADKDAREKNGYTPAEMAEGQYRFPDELKDLLKP